MSVTESKAKKVKKASPKASTRKADAQSDVLVAVLDSAPVSYTAWSRLFIGDLNCRLIPHTPEEIRGYADSIFAVGQIHNIVVVECDDGRLEVVCGGGRTKAIGLLVEEGKVDPDHEWISCKVVPRELARAISLTENGRHKTMHPAEQIAGFRSLAEEGKTPAQIGDLLGYGVKHVQRMLKLAGLAPVLLQALAEDKITTEHCQALALEDNPDRQVQVYEAACRQSWNNKPEVRVIRNLITDSQVSTLNNSKYAFVGEKAFSGDEIRADLFSDEQGCFVDKLALDTALLEKLQVVAECLKEAEGWAWATGRLDVVSSHGEDSAVYRIQDEPDAVYTEQEQQRMDELQSEYDENQTASDDTDAMESEMEAIECAAQLRAWTPEMRAQSGVVVSWHQGDICVQRGVILREQSETEDEPAQIPVYERQPEPVDEISLPLLTKMSSERTLALQAALVQKPEKTVALMVWRLCTCVFDYCNTTRDPFVMRLEVHHNRLVSEAPSGEEGKAWQSLMQEKARLEALLPEGWKKDFTTFFTLDGKTLMSLMVFCTACSVDGVQTRTMGHTTRSDLDGVERAVDFNLHEWWQPTKNNFFDYPMNWRSSENGECETFMLAEMICGNVTEIYARIGNRAVAVVMKEVEQLVSARITQEGKTETVLTGSMVAALYNHDTSRDLDPQVHTHALVFNATFADEKWRSLASDTRMKTGFSENLYATKIALGNLYRSALREDIESMGFETVAAGKHGLWELKDVPVDIFSSRSQAIREAAGPDASAKSRDVAALDTRQAKAWADPDLLKADWRRRLTDEKFDIGHYISQAQARVEITAPVVAGQGGMRAPGQPGIASSGEAADELVQKAVSDTISALSDKKVQFTWSEMLAGTVSRLPSAPGLFEQARAGIEAAIEGQRLIPLDREKGIFTSDIHLLNELSVHQLARTAVAEQTVLVLPERAQERDIPAGDAVSVLSQDKSPVAILSGRGGAQTLRERTEDVAMMARSQGREVMVIAADGRSGQFLSESPHLAGHVMLRSQMNADTVLPVQGTVIVDRAERLSLKETVLLQEKALSAGAQLIFMDTENRQGTGNALSVLKEADIPQYRFYGTQLPEVRLVSEADKRSRYGQLAQEYVRLSAEGRDVVAQVTGTREQQQLTEVMP